MLYPITFKEIQRLRKCGESTAKRHLKVLRSLLQRHKYQQVYLHELCTFEQIDFDIAKTELGIKK